MSKQVEIKAELLKWCPYRFEFELINSLGIKYAFVGVDGDWIQMLDVYSAEYDFQTLLEEKVLVNAKDYEKAVIERIKEMIPDATMIIKRREGVFAMTRHYIPEGNSNGEFVVSTGRQYIDISCDPQPWEDRYNIEIGE